jgi:hypothetical protein
MSSNGQSKREQDVLDQQRRLAMMMANKAKPPPPTGTGKPSKSLKAGGLTLKAAAAPPTKPKPPPRASASQTMPTPKAAPPLKKPTRPTLKRPSTSSVANVLAAARAKASTSHNSGAGSTSTTSSSTIARSDSKPAAIAINTSIISSKPAGGISSKGSPKLLRKAKSVNSSSSSRLAKLIQNVAAVGKGDSLASDAFASNTTPEDFWKNLREWDLVTDLAEQQQQQQQQHHSAGGDKATENESKIPARKPIPDTFISPRHYVALWAPLCLAETRAQLLSDVLTEQNYNRRPPLLLVDVETTWKSGGYKKNDLHSTELISFDSCHVMIKTKERGDGGHLQFFTHDMCCLIPVEHKDTVERLLRGGLVVNNAADSFKKYGMIGHTESSRKELNGLILKVSKRRWTLLGKSEMFLLKIGSNITALREFTALCAVETIPLKRYLLGHHLENSDKSVSHLTQEANSSSRKKQELLNKMGGVEALGKGFTEYAQQKFNPSQLMAISASAKGYGDGGFTLIKVSEAIYSAWHRSTYCTFVSHDQHFRGHRELEVSIK